MYKLTIVLVFFLLLLGCQTKLDKAGYRHAADLTAWRELARYSNIELSYWGLTITANIQVVEGTGGRTMSSKILNYHQLMVIQI
ncbi:hypothetical protein RT723_08060 [Psychrosphaera aquimarina]|uniref:Uncharacterized protein n=1 Tax=Psychrosphaera aquimarina TaxID=2044854 RepID=A0ABU3R084_9GAMM|nr:hypothetical protein [Psychrosphaera aquimarina]MDU0112949.1 hypothetical protein [Psychrosphaera aquimarina]